MPPRRRTTAAVPQLRFDQKLVLQQWMFRQLGAKDLHDLCDRDFRKPEAEGRDAENVSLFHHLLAARSVLAPLPELPVALLRAYDENIFRHTTFINRRRAEPLRWKYFQYIALLFTEIYLDRYFRDSNKLLTDLNALVAEFNIGKLELDQVAPYRKEDLKKLAIWQATGSGKTLLMHLQIRQYLHYLEKSGRQKELNKIILLTPKEGLSRQHLTEFTLSGIDAELFDKDGDGQRTMFSGQLVEIIDVNKLSDESKEKTVAVESFEGNNLVLVDEGHRGSSGEEWMRRRDALCAQGFSFEYSATFGQAVKAAKDRVMEGNYARWVLFDYSYRHFHGDGYGKHYRIFNLKKEFTEEQRHLYLTAALLSFYQQLRVFNDHAKEFVAYNVERPLWVFFGASVNEVRMEHGKEVSDILSVLLFFAEFVKHRADSIRRLDALLTAQDGLLGRSNEKLFARAFDYLAATLKMSGATVFDDILRTLFNAPTGGMLHVRNLKGADGELSLCLGENEPFGVINVGDEGKLYKLCEKHRESIATSEHEFARSLFDVLSRGDSRIHVLLGSKKFTEGWNSWRVTSIGLMNLGKSEGSEIIQLFGRGVRLKGWNMTLKRSDKLDNLNPPRFLKLVETLDVFGVRADYMEKFREYLETEGVQTELEWVEIPVPALPTLKDIAAKKLKTIRVPENLDYKRDAPRPTLDPEREFFERHPVRVNWYPRIEAMKASGLRELDPTGTLNEAPLGPRQLAFLDRESLWRQLQQFKTERGFSNLRLQRSDMDALLSQPYWYRLAIPKEELDFTHFDRIRVWQQIAGALLTGYCERLYKYRKQEWESQHAEVELLDENDPNFFPEYIFQVEKSEQALIDQISDLATQVKAGTLRSVSFNAIKALRWDPHLYQPLIHISGTTMVELSPVELNVGEWDFIEHLRAFHGGNASFFADKEFYLLRNRSKKGLGFFEAGNFYPDFIVWLLHAGRQYVSFVDPKGLLHTQGFDDPKIAFHERIKELETRLHEPDLVLNSFIISSTSHSQIAWWDKLKTPEDFEKHHIFFQKDEGYIGKMFARIVASQA
jgi:hypothetical protein